MGENPQCGTEMLRFGENMRIANIHAKPLTKISLVVCFLLSPDSRCVYPKTYQSRCVAFSRLIPYPAQFYSLWHKRSRSGMKKKTLFENDFDSSHTVDVGAHASVSSYSIGSCSGVCVCLRRCMYVCNHGKSK